MSKADSQTTILDEHSASNLGGCWDWSCRICHAPIGAEPAGHQVGERLIRGWSAKIPDDKTTEDPRSLAAVRREIRPPRPRVICECGGTIWRSTCVCGSCGKVTIIPEAESNG